MTVLYQAFKKFKCLGMRTFPTDRVTRELDEVFDAVEDGIQHATFAAIDSPNVPRNEQALNSMHASSGPNADAVWRLVLNKRNEWESQRVW